MGSTPSYHPCLFGIFHEIDIYKHPAMGVPPTDGNPQMLRYIIVVDSKSRSKRLLVIGPASHLSLPEGIPLQPLIGWVSPYRLQTVKCR